MARTKVVLVCPNDLVVDTRGQKMAASLAALGMDVTVVARASDRAAPNEMLGEVPVIRIPVPVVGRVHPPAPQRSADFRKHAQTRRQQAQGAGVAAKAPGRSLRSRVRLAGRVVALAAAATVSSTAGRVAGLRERLAMAPMDSIGSRDPWPGWRETMWLPLVMAEAFWPTIESLAPDVIHCHDLDALVACGTAQQRLLDSGRDAKLVYDAHENWAGLPEIDWIREVHNSFLGVEAEFIRSADLVVTVSEVIADTLQVRYELPRRPLVLLNTPSLKLAERAPATLRIAANVDDGADVMVYSGSISHARSVPSLIEALPLLPGVHLVIVPVPHPHRLVPGFEELALKLGVRDRLHIAPPVAASQVVDYLSTADVGVHPLLPGSPNHEAALPNKLFEYLHAGIPVVVSNCRAMSEFVAENHVGCSFQHGSPESLAAAVSEVLTGRAAGRYIADPATVARYTWESQEEALGLAYAEMLARKPTCLPQPEVAG